MRDSWIGGRNTANMHLLDSNGAGGLINKRWESTTQDEHVLELMVADGSVSVFGVDTSCSKNPWAIESQIVNRL